MWQETGTLLGKPSHPVSRAGGFKHANHRLAMLCRNPMDCCTASLALVRHLAILVGMGGVDKPVHCKGTGEEM